MNPGVQALERLVEAGLFLKGQPHPSAPVQYWPAKAPSARQWPNAAGLVHRAASWCGKRGLSVMRGRGADDLVYCYAQKEDLP